MIELATLAAAAFYAYPSTNGTTALGTEQAAEAKIIKVT